jgi:hypothetical protein
VSQKKCYNSKVKKIALRKKNNSLMVKGKRGRGRGGRNLGRGSPILCKGRREREGVIMA